MRIGILADIHEDVVALQRALAILQAEQVSQLVVLGDLFYRGRQVTEIVDQLRAAGAVGVWGNHDLGFCHEPEPSLLARYPDHVAEYVKTLAPRLELAGCLFSHGLTHWDATDPAAYYLGEPIESETGRAASFAASTSRISFVGHFHRWLVATPACVDPWQGADIIQLQPGQRYLVAIAAVCDGWCAVYDSANSELTPHRLVGIS